MKKIILIITSFFIMNLTAFATTTKSAIVIESVKANEDYNKGKLLYEQKKYKEADLVLKKAKDAYPEEKELIKLYAKNLSALGKFKESYKVLEKLIIVNNVYVKEDTELYELQIVNIENLIKNKIVVEGVELKEALIVHMDTHADIVWNENPMSPDEIFSKGNEFMKAKKYADALKVFELDRSEDKRNLLGAGVTARFIGDNDKAIKYFTKLIEVDPTLIRAYKELAMTYQDNKNYEKAVENFRIYLDSVPEERTYFVLANIYYSSVYRDYGKAREILLEAQTNFPESKAIGDLLKDVNKKLGIKEEVIKVETIKTEVTVE